MTQTGEGLTAGVVGLGVMGSSIARHLHQSGRSVAGFDLAETARARAASEGIAVASSTAALAGEVDLVITSLPSAAALEQVTDEITMASAVPRYLVETSTLALSDKERLRARLLDRGTEVLDCPVSGTGEQMARGDAVVYASGDAAAYEVVRPTIEAFARACHYAGAFGNGTRLKFVANLLVAVHNVAAAEAIALAALMGLSLPEALDALLDGAGSSKMLEVRGPAMLERRYLPGAMRMGLFEKDLRLIAEHAQELGAETPLFTSSLAVYEAARARGLLDEDTAAVFEVLLPPSR